MPKRCVVLRPDGVPMIFGLSNVIFPDGELTSLTFDGFEGEYAPLRVTNRLISFVPVEGVENAKFEVDPDSSPTGDPDGDILLGGA